VLGQIARRRPVDAVLISVGANDAFFGEIVRFCAFRPAPNCFDETLPRADGKTVDAAVRSGLRALPQGYARLARRIASGRRIPSDRVHVVEYFDPTRDGRGDTCRTLFGFISAPEPELARTVVLDPLNDLIAKAAEDHGWTLVEGMATRFHNHGYCAGRQAWVTTLSGSLVRLGGPIAPRFLGTLHPNEAGHDAIAEGIAASLAARLYPGADLKPGARTPPPDDDGLTTLAIAGIVTGGLLAALGIGALGWFLGRRAAP
jgi:hypothetical protein